MVKKLLAVSVLLALVAIPVSAATMSYNTSTPIASTLTDWSDTLAFQQFDSSLGTLVSVQLNLSATMVTNLTIASSSSATGYARTEVVMNVQDTGMNLVGSPVDILSPTYPFTDLNGTVYSGALSKTGSSSDTYTSAAVLAVFTGTGNIILDATAEATTLLSYTGGNVEATQVTCASLGGEVIYTYIVPEPATMGLLATGMLALLRRKKK